MSTRELVRGDPGGGQSPSSSLQRDPMPVAPFFPIIAVAGSIRKQRAPKGMNVRRFPSSIFGGGGVRTSRLTMQRSAFFVLKITRKQILFNL